MSGRTRRTDGGSMRMTERARGVEPRTGVSGMTVSDSRVRHAGRPRGGPGNAADPAAINAYECAAPAVAEATEFRSPSTSPAALVSDEGRQNNAIRPYGGGKACHSGAQHDERYGGSVFSKEIEVRTGDRAVVHDLTGDAELFLTDCDATDGLLNVWVPHATAGVVIIETGAGSDDDLLAAIDELLPRDGRWRHQHGAPGHGRDHVLPAFLPPSATVPVVAGSPTLGTWQSLCLVDTNIDNPVRKVRFSFLPG